MSKWGWTKQAYVTYRVPASLRASISSHLLTQRSQYPLLKEDTLNYRGLILWFKVYSLTKGYWDLKVLSWYRRARKSTYIPYANAHARMNACACPHVLNCLSMWRCIWSQCCSVPPPCSCNGMLPTMQCKMMSCCGHHVRYACMCMDAYMDSW